ncbi:hypothetical protein AcW1_010167 [Taiwanofungus camphoratus]|nr:hypothetical protein AcW1_010167 [Antrodia cinnamomea]
MFPIPSHATPQALTLGGIGNNPSPLWLLLSNKSNAPSTILPPQAIPSPSQTGPLLVFPSHTHAEPPLLPAESAAPQHTLSPLAAPHSACTPGHPLLTLLPHAAEFPSTFYPPPHPNTDPWANGPQDHISLTPVFSNLWCTAWAYYLCDYPDPTFIHTLLQIIDHGANIGFTGDHTSPQASCNLASAALHNDVMAADLQLQLVKNHMHGPFTSIPFSNFCSSPLGTTT